MTTVGAKRAYPIRVTFCASFRPSRKAASICEYAPRNPPLKNPIVGNDGCCAHAESGHEAAAPPRSVMNSRRRMSDPKLRRQHLSGSNEYLGAETGIKTIAAVHSQCR